MSNFTDYIKDLPQEEKIEVLIRKVSMQQNEINNLENAVGKLFIYDKDSELKEGNK